MAYGVLPTVVTQTGIASSWGNGVKANFDAAFPLGVDGWTSFTPTLTQLGAVTKTVTYAKYQRVGRLIVAQYLLNITGAGTANNAIVVGLPVTAAQAGFMACGSGEIFDTSVSAHYGGIVLLATTTTFNLLGTSTNVGQVLGVTGASFAAALASGDAVGASIMYEAAT